MTATLTNSSLPAGYALLLLLLFKPGVSLAASWGVVSTVTGPCSITAHDSEAGTGVTALEKGRRLESGDRLECKEGGRLVIRRLNLTDEIRLSGPTVYWIPFAAQEREPDGRNRGGAVASGEMNHLMPTAKPSSRSETRLVALDSDTKISGAKGGLERCDTALGTLALFEDTDAAWWQDLRARQLGSTVPVLHQMIKQSNCFVIVDRNQGLARMARERALIQSSESRGGSNFGKGQMVAADYTISPEVLFGDHAALRTRSFLRGLFAAVGDAETNASATLMLVDNRSGLQISAAEGKAKNVDLSAGTSALFGISSTGSGGYTQTPQGKVVVASFADSYNQLVKSLRAYKAQSIETGLGTGGALKANTGQTRESTSIEPASAPASAAGPGPASSSAVIPMPPASATSAPVSPP